MRHARQHQLGQNRIMYAKRRPSWLFVLVLTLLLLPGCAGWRPVKVPMDTRFEASACLSRPDTLLVFLPGAYSHPDEFDREGFVQAVRARKLAADMLLVDAHMGYYNGRSILERLHQDVIVPARARGYNKVWLVGISVGGFGSFLYADDQPQQVDGIVAIAPYLGGPALSREIKGAGGLLAWTPATAMPAGAEQVIEQRVWRWLQHQNGPLDGKKLPPVYLGYATEDRFALSHQILAAALPSGQVFTTAGGHDWPAWRRLWRSLLEVLPLARCG